MEGKFSDEDLKFFVVEQCLSGKTVLELCARAAMELTPRPPDDAIQQKVDELIAQNLLQNEADSRGEHKTVATEKAVTWYQPERVRLDRLDSEMRITQKQNDKLLPKNEFFIKYAIHAKCNGYYNGVKMTPELSESQQKEIECILNTVPTFVDAPKMASMCLQLCSLYKSIWRRPHVHQSELLEFAVCAYAAIDPDQRRWYLFANYLYSGSMQDDLVDGIKDAIDYSNNKGWLSPVNNKIGYLKCTQSTTSIVEWLKSESEMLEKAPRPKAALPRRGRRTVNIERLASEIRAVLIASKDHVISTGELLPRPTQEEVGKRLGLSKSTVSRCFTDKSKVASAIRMLYEKALDAKRVRDFRG